MATCPQCRKQIPDASAHCGYCGVAIKAPPSIQEKKTMFGYAGMMPQAKPAPAPATTPAAPSDALAKTQWSTPDPAQPQAAPPAQPQRRTAPQAPAPQPYTPTLAAPASLPSSGSDKLPAPASLRRSQAVPQAQPRVSPSAAASPPPAYLATIAASSTPAPASVPPTAIGPAPAIPPTMYAPAQAAVPSPAATPAPKAPRGDLSRPVLASESLAEDLAPIEPGRTAMRALMLVGGLLLVGLFCSPVGKTGDKLLFSWDLLKDQEGLRFVLTIYLAAGGGVFLAAALLPLPYIVRALAGAVVGLTPLGVMMATMEDWRPVTAMGALALLVAALFHRWRYRRSIVARILVGLGAAAVLATLLVPTGQGVPLVLAFQGLGNASAQQLVQQLFPLVLMLLALLSLLAFLPAGTTGLAQVWAIGLLLYLPVTLLWGGLTNGPSDPWRMMASLQPGIPILVYITLGPLGLAQVLAKLSPAQTSASR
jgi:hypothetical protein